VLQLQSYEKFSIPSDDNNDVLSTSIHTDEDSTVSVHRQDGDRDPSTMPSASANMGNTSLWCYCRQDENYMIWCDNEECPIEWFHLSCVNMTMDEVLKANCVVQNAAKVFNILFFTIYMMILIF